MLISVCVVIPHTLIVCFICIPQYTTSTVHGDWTLIHFLLPHTLWLHLNIVFIYRSIFACGLSKPTHEHCMSIYIPRLHMHFIYIPQYMLPAVCVAISTTPFHCIISFVYRSIPLCASLCTSLCTSLRTSMCTLCTSLCTLCTSQCTSLCTLCTSLCTMCTFTTHCAPCGLIVHLVHLTVHHVHLHNSLCTMCTFTVHPCALHCAPCAPCLCGQSYISPPVIPHTLIATILHLYSAV